MSMNQWAAQYNDVEIMLKTLPTIQDDCKVINKFKSISYVFNELSAIDFT